MKIALCIITFLFAGLHLFAASMNLRKSEEKFNNILMIVGSIFSFAGMVFSLLKNPFEWVMVLIGLGCVVCAAILNGKKQGNLHIKHHIVRIVISFVLICGFAMI